MILLVVEGPVGVDRVICFIPNIKLNTKNTEKDIKQVKDHFYVVFLKSQLAGMTTTVFLIIS